jgi:hypothetical protein
MKTNNRIIWVAKDKETGTLLPKAGVWTSESDPEIERFKKRVSDCEVVKCLLQEITNSDKQ